MAGPTKVKSLTGELTLDSTSRRKDRGSRFEVRLRGTPTEIHLEVGDRGIGFDVEAALKSPGIA